jgi:uncharacterized protein (DUF2062 family)
VVLWLELDVNQIWIRVLSTTLPILFAIIGGFTFFILWKYCMQTLLLQKLQQGTHGSILSFEEYKMVVS